MFTYNADNPPIHHWLKKEKKLLLRNEKAKLIGENIQIAHKQPRNLKSLICGPRRHLNVKQEDNAGCFKCGSCHACNVVTESRHFISTNTSKRYYIRQHISCNSSFVIYLATCKLCQGQYVGKSIQEFKRRHSGHKYEIKNQIGGLGHHFGREGGCGYANISFTIIERIVDENREVLAEREVFWQHQLRCYVENGYNGHCYRKEV